MDHDVALVLAGGLIGLASSVVALSLQRLWSVRDRRAAIEREALDLTVQQLMAWKDVALGILSGAPNTAADRRRFELDAKWQIDPRLIPDREATEELIRRCQAIILAPSVAREGRLLEESDRLIRLADRALDSARKRMRDLA